jgi:hypothetical protein
MTDPPQGGQYGRPGSYGPPGPHGQPRYGAPAQPPYGRPGQGQPPQPPHGPPGPYGPPGQYGPPGYGQAPGAPPYGQPPYGVPYGRPGYGPPAPGQPGYGPPAPGQPGYGPPPRRARTGLVAALVAVAVVVLALAIVLPRALGTEVLDPAAVENDVAAQFEQAHGVTVDLRCEQQMAVEPGASYECAGTTADGEEITVRIAITDADTAAYTWEEV